MRSLAPVALAVLGALVCCQPPERSGERAGRSAALSPCRAPGLAREALCGTHSVFEDRAAQSGRQIALKVVVIPALSDGARPDPIFFLAGGPGQAATEVFEKVAPAFERAMRRRDVVLVDQRGTGSSNALDCQRDDPREPLAKRFAADELEPDALRRCLAGYDADPRLYTTPIAMDDLDEVRAALGYSKVNLWGGSYGTRAALVYLRQHSDTVRSVVLDGTAPMGMVLPLSQAQDGQRAMDLVFEHCRQEPACERAFPDLRRRFERVLDDLNKGGLRSVAHPLSGIKEQVPIRRLDFAGGVRSLLYSAEMASLVPYTIAAAERGDYAPFVAATLSFSDRLGGSISLGMHLSVICSEDMPLAREAEVTAAVGATFLGEDFFRRLGRVCAFWPRGALPAGYSERVVSDAPVLLLSGELDPVTPPRHAEDARRGLSRSAHFIAPGVGHGVTPMGCAPRLVAEFLEHADPGRLDATCLGEIRRPPFVTSFAGPTP